MRPDVDVSSRSHTYPLECPACGHGFELEIELTTGAFEDTLPKHERPRPERFSSREIALLEAAERAGVLKAFISAAERARSGSVPKDMDRYFLGFLQMARTVRIPHESLKMCIERFGGLILAWEANGVLLITSDGHPVLFAPTVIARGVSGTPVKLPVGDGLEEWIRTKHGYVAGKGLLFQELRRRSIGEFARPML